MALDRYVQHGSRHLRRHAHRKLSKVAPKPSPNTNAAEVATADSDNSTAILPSVANANAQMTAANTPAGNGKAMSAWADDILPATTGNPTDTQPPAAQTQIAAADQLNDVDRALQENKPVAAAFAMAPAGRPVASSSNESSIWERTSLIGKIFMGFGALLTMASAVRMFVA
jgi:hypothetical protein